MTTSELHIDMGLPCDETLARRARVQTFFACALLFVAASSCVVMLAQSAGAIAQVLTFKLL